MDRIRVEKIREEEFDLQDAITGNFVSLINSKLQYAGTSRPSRRHRVKNNMPGKRNFCPLNRKTEKLEQFIAEFRGTIPIW